MTEKEVYESLACLYQFASTTPFDGGDVIEELVALFELDKKTFRAYVSRRKWKEKRLSLDNGLTFYCSWELEEIKDDIERLWDGIVQLMDDTVREKVHAENYEKDKIGFLKMYLTYAKEDLIVG